MPSGHWRSRHVRRCEWLRAETMPSGAAVIRYEGVRGVVWYAKFRDAAGRQVKKKLGAEAQGWTEKKAQRALGTWLDKVERERWRRVDSETFETFARRFLDEYLPGRNLKRSTTIDYEGALRRHLVPFLGHLTVDVIEAGDVDAYISAKAGTLAPKTIANHVALLRVMFKVALRWRIVQASPLAHVEPPRVEQTEMNVLTETEIAALLGAYDDLAASDDEKRAWWLLTKRLTTVALGTGLRRGELLALRWRDVKLLEGLLTVRESLVRGEFQAPKSRTSRRTIELGTRTAAALQEQWQASPYRSDDDLVFGHPQIGSALDPSKLSRGYMRPALRHAGIVKPFRPWHDLRHTALTHEAAAGNPAVYVQLKAGHSQGSITERYIHAAQVLFPGAAEKGEARTFGGLEVPNPVPKETTAARADDSTAPLAGTS